MQPGTLAEQYADGEPRCRPRGTGVYALAHAAPRRRMTTRRPSRRVAVVPLGTAVDRGGRRDLEQSDLPHTFRCFPDGACGNRLAPVEIQRVAFETQPDKLLPS